ncbi:phenylacetic acid degradation protein [Pilimelia terevasa]|uniref:Phenylacetic acid degradation protein n=1 Tax=Pilimelia terevasa TaxID=53372 RepID=A0A8J3BQW8_9ACTN|nr:1,2-phenylacetyl-CoA epoxidase subunit PaaE [Pilimelia terevasa]GGK21306.1 phenylacetic acid degradation protein [Pilimelia terevasa]
MSSVTVRKPTRRRPVFHALPVTAIDQLTDEALAITMAVPAELRGDFAFTAGQHLTVRRVDESGEEVRRSYSICSTPRALAAGGTVRIGVKAIPGGSFSAWAAAHLRVGQTIDVLPPLGHFTTEFDPGRARRYAGIVAGSGITPVLSLAATALETEPDSTVTLLYGNRYARSVMFAEELADLKDRYPARLHVLHVLSREAQEAALLSGRLDRDRLARLFATLVPPAGIDEWFLCGPFEMVETAHALLRERGVPAERVHSELFFVASASAAPAPVVDAAAGDTEVTLLLDGRASTFPMARGERVLDAALRVRAELPYACKGGVCSTCRAKVTVGKVEMAHNYALEPDELARGYVLTCQSTPLTDALTVDFDA